MFIHERFRAQRPICLRWSIVHRPDLAGTLSTGHGTLFATLVFENQVTTCDGPVTCGVLTQMVETVTASLLD